MRFPFWPSAPNYQQKRLTLLKQAPPGPLQDFLNVPFPASDLALSETPILALDFETTGLDPNSDHLLSAGWVSVHNNQIYLNSSFHQLIRSTNELQESNVKIHQITEQENQQGELLAEAIAKLLAALAGKVMLAHYHKIEVNFLQQACVNLWGIAPTFPVIDTMLLAQQYLEQKQVPYQPNDLNLSRLRDKQRLPAHHAHNALNDAIATAELFLAQIANKSDTQLKLKDVLI